MPDVLLQSVLPCPQCRSTMELTMPTDACLQVYECPQCKAVLRRNASTSLERESGKRREAVENARVELFNNETHHMQKGGRLMVPIEVAEKTRASPY